MTFQQMYAPELVAEVFLNVELTMHVIQRQDPNNIRWQILGNVYFSHAPGSSKCVLYYFCYLPGVIHPLVHQNGCFIINFIVSYQA